MDGAVAFFVFEKHISTNTSTFAPTSSGVTQTIGVAVESRCRKSLRSVGADGSATETFGGEDCAESTSRNSSPSTAHTVASSGYSFPQ